MTQRQQKLVWLLALMIFAVFCAAVGWYIGVPMIEMARAPAQFRAWVDSHGVLGRILFVAMVVIQVLVAFIPGEPVELLAGYAFGAVEGTLLTLLGFLIGSWLIFLLVRRCGVRLVEVFFSQKQIVQLRFLKNPQKTQILAFILMSVPGTPKDFLSYFAGLTPMTLKQWLGIVAIARLPSLLTSTVTGAAAGDENYLLSAVMLCLTLFMSLIGIVYYRHLTKLEQT